MLYRFSHSKQCFTIGGQNDVEAALELSTSLSILISAKPQSPSPTNIIAAGACNGMSALWAAGLGCPGWFLCTAHSKRTQMLLMHVSLTIGRPQKYIRPHYKRAAASIPAFLLTVVAVRKPHCASEKQFLNCSQNTPVARQDGHQRGASWDTRAPITGDALSISVLREENRMSPCTVFRHHRVKYRWCQASGLHDCQLFYFLY